MTLKNNKQYYNNHHHGKDPPAKKPRLAEQESEDDPLLLHNQDIWVKNILPFVGPGHFIYVAGVSQKFKELYKLYRTIHDAFGTAEWNGTLANVMKDLIDIRQQQRS